MSKAGVYIHIPFCARKCPYCDFYSLAGAESMFEIYAKALIRDIQNTGNKDIAVDSIYFGGGTPTLMPAKLLCDICEAVKNSFNTAEDTEITVESNPFTADKNYYKELIEAGFNRISFGVQSCLDRELKALGRLHSFEQAEKSVLEAHDAGFENISCDLMMGIIGQSVESLIYSIDKLCSLPIKHISAYMLKIENGTPYDCDKIRNSIADDDKSVDMYLTAVEGLKENGFEQYEISNFCKGGMRSRHNMKYWQLKPYYGFGSSAHSFIGGKRYYYDRDIVGYINAPEKLLEDGECNALEEYTMLSLRLSDGMSVQRYKELGGDIAKLETLADRLCKHCMAEYDGKRLSLNAKGFLVSNSIIAELI